MALTNPLLKLVLPLVLLSTALAGCTGSSGHYAIEELRVAASGPGMVQIGLPVPTVKDVVGIKDWFEARALGNTVGTLSMVAGDLQRLWLAGDGKAEREMRIVRVGDDPQEHFLKSAWVDGTAPKIDVHVLNGPVDVVVDYDADSGRCGGHTTFAGKALSPGYHTLTGTPAVTCKK